MKRVLAIDGPSGSGKSTVARAAAETLGLPVLDTGAMYRAVTWAVLGRGADPGDPETCGAIARTLVVVQDGARTTVDGRDVSREIREPAVTAQVSAVSSHPEVRGPLVAQQRAWVDARGGGVVEGRDIGTVVFPDAALKVFLEASEEERARRRYREHADGASLPGTPPTVDAVRDAHARRDAWDSSRRVAPLRASPDAVTIETTHRTVEDIVGEIVDRFQEAWGVRA